jgi:hypothetical protein
MVREQVNTYTAPEHNYPEQQVTNNTAPEPCFPDSQVACTTYQSHTHWVEKYWVKSHGEKHEYYRYCWMEGRKMYRSHISGRAGSIGANNRKEIVESALADGESPQEINPLLSLST